jgi:hypothetical protein
MSRKPFIVACVPAYNEARTIAQVTIEEADVVIGSRFLDEDSESCPRSMIQD